MRLRWIACWSNIELSTKKNFSAVHSLKTSEDSPPALNAPDRKLIRIPRMKMIVRTVKRLISPHEIFMKHSWCALESEWQTHSLWAILRGNHVCLPFRKFDVTLVYSVSCVAHNNALPRWADRVSWASMRLCASPLFQTDPIEHKHFNRIS